MTLCLVTVIILAGLMMPGKARAYSPVPKKPAIVLAAFGTCVPEALKALENVESRVKSAFPDYDVHLAFTSNMIRRVWRTRLENSKGDDPVAARYGAVKNPLSVLAEIQETGASSVYVQSLHVTDGEEFQNLAGLIDALNDLAPLQESLRPFLKLRLGAPALGLGDGELSRLDKAAQALGHHIQLVMGINAALVLAGHGNERLRQGVFKNLEDRLRLVYKRIYVGTLETEPGVAAIAEALANDKPPSMAVLLAPLMVVAGDHAINDMAGDEPDSWKSVLRAQGLAVDPRLTGLGGIDAWADIYVDSIREMIER